MHRNGRGLNQGDPIESEYGGNIRAYESSAAEGPHLWVRIECPVNLNDPRGAQKEAVAHLSLENAAQLRDQLTELIANHYQVQELIGQGMDGET